jgi:hypothetical protein
VLPPEPVDEGADAIQPGETRAGSLRMAARG